MKRQSDTDIGAWLFIAAQSFIKKQKQKKKNTDTRYRYIYITGIRWFGLQVLCEFIVGSQLSRNILQFPFSSKLEMQTTDGTSK